MNLSNLKPAKGSIKKNSKRVGRGQGSGKGGTSTRGHKGAKSRSGYSRKLGFEGGQMPLHLRVPKFGFTNMNRKEYQIINLDTLDTFVKANKLSEVVDFEALVDSGLVRRNELVKIGGRGSISLKLVISAHKFTKSAEAAIVAAGGSVIIL